MATPIVALDYETEYSADYSVTEMGAINYALDPRFRCYCVSMARSNGETFSGKPQDAPWHWLDGALVLAANVMFEQACSYRLKLDKIFPEDIEPADWQDVLDLGAYLCMSQKRGLAYLTKSGLGVSMDKDPRAKAKGVTAEEFWSDPDLWEEITEYCLQDSMATLALWMKYAHLWPENERTIARITRESAIQGIYLDTPALEEAREILQAKIEEFKGSMPWVQRGEKPMSINAFKDTCEMHGLVCPKSTNKLDPDFAQFVSDNIEEYPWITSIGELRRANRTDKVLATMSRLSRDSVMHVGLRYAGAHTLRWSGNEMNLQNLNSKPVFGINLRNVLHARPGKTLVVRDYRQIEPRTLFWSVKDEDFLALVRQGYSVYEAYARANMGWTGGTLSEEDPTFYKLAKATCVSGDTLIRVKDRGWMPIKDIQKGFDVWDGYEYVTCDGIVNNGRKETISYAGTRLTPDHRILTRSGWQEASSEGRTVPEEEWERLPRARYSWADVRALGGALRRSAHEGWLSLRILLRRVCNGLAPVRQPEERQVDLLSQIPADWDSRVSPTATAVGIDDGEVLR